MNSVTIIFVSHHAFVLIIRWSVCLLKMKINLWLLVFVRFFVALNICDRNFGYRICLYDYHMKFLRKINCDFNLHLLSYMHGNQWLATDYKERFYLFNDDDDKIQSIIDYTNKGGFIRNICRLSSNSIAVKIMNRLQIYRVSFWCAFLSLVFLDDYPLDS